MLGKRKEKLLRGMAEDLQNGTPPLNSEFLGAHGVTLDECLDMSELAGNILAGFLMLPDDFRVAVVTQAAFGPDDKGIARMVFDQLVRDYFTKRTIDGLRESVKETAVPQVGAK